MMRSAFGAGFFGGGGGVDGGPFTITLDGVEVAPADLVASGQILLGARQEAYPNIRDYAGTLSDDDLTAADISGVAPADRVYTYHERPVSFDTSNASFRTIDDDSFRVVFQLLGTPGNPTGFFSWGGSGDTQATNFAYAVRFNGLNQIEFFCEFGSGANREATWQIPDGMVVGGLYEFTFTRTSGLLKAFYGGKQLKRVVGVAGGTNNGDGTVSGMASNGGTSATFALATATVFNPAVIGIRGEATPDADALDAIVVWDDSAWVPDQSTLEARIDEDTLALFTVDSDGVIDLTEGVSSGDWDTDGGQDNYYDDVWLTDNGWVLSASASASLRVTGPLTLDMGAVWQGTTGTFVGIAGLGDTAPDNYLYSLNVDASSITYFVEEGPGTNVEVEWTLPSTLRVGDFFTVRLLRNESEEVSLEYNGEVLDVSSTTGTNNGQSASVPNPTGGGDAQFGLGGAGGAGAGTNRAVRFVQIRNVAV